MYIIYRAVSKTTKKSYVGATEQLLKQRISLHKTRAKSARTAPFYKALRRYGFDDFSWEILFKTDNRNELPEKEMYFIQKLHTLEPNGYNARFGLDYLITDEQRQKLSDSRTGASTSRERRMQHAMTHGKPVKCINTKKVYASILQAHLATKVVPRAIRKSCSGKTIRSKWKFEWASKEEITEIPIL